MAGPFNNGLRSKRRLNAEMNVVPYIDVMLVLLVIFMVTAPLLTQGIDVELPETSSQPLPTDDHPVTLFVDANGRYFLDIGADTKQALADADVTDLLSKVLRNKPDTLVLVRADKAVPYAAVVRGMSLLQAAGANKIGFVTDPNNNPGNNPSTSNNAPGKASDKRPPG